MEARCVSDYLSDLKEGCGAAEACVALFSVAHCVDVREQVAGDAEAVTALAEFIGEVGADAVEVRWESLALIGELCRRERQTSRDGGGGGGGGDEGGPLSRTNDVALRLAQQFVDTAALRPALKHCAKQKGAAHETSHEIATDLLNALPFPGVTGWKGKAKDLLFLDPRLSKPWPRVTRADRRQCILCQTTVTSPMRCAQCKAVFYCGTACQKKHWKMGHKARCATFLESDVANPLSNVSKLFFPTRAQLYADRPKILAKVDFETYFFEYILPPDHFPEDLYPNSRPGAELLANTNSKEPSKLEDGETGLS